MRYPRVLRPLICVFLGCLPAAAQAVISTHAGTINFSEGEVFLDDQPLNQKVASFPSVKDGSTIRTAKGRVEILLQPSVFLRVDDDSAVRMVSNDLSKTRIDFLKGAVILDSSDQPAGTSLVLSYKTYQFRFIKPGVYRVNSEPGILETYSGEAELVADGQPAPKKVDEAHEFFLDIGMLTPKYGDGTTDAFSEWARQRSETIAAANRAQQGVTDPADSNGDPGYDLGPGLPGINPGSGYGSVSPGYGGIDPGYGSMTGPVVVTPPAYGAYPAWGLYGSTWGTPFLLPNTFVYLLPVYYRRYPNPNSRYPNPNRWSHHSVYPALTPSQVGMGLSHSPGLGLPVTSPRLGLSSPRINVATPHYYTVPRYSPSIGVHSAAPHVMVHR